MNKHAELIEYLHWNSRMIQEFREQGEQESVTLCKLAYDDLCFQIAENDSGKNIPVMVVKQSTENGISRREVKRKGFHR